ncbi:MAG: serine hydrolase domain-containing protein, partial [Pseudomonadota bacterium]
SVGQIWQEAGDNDTCWVDNVQIAATGPRLTASSGPRRALTQAFLTSQSPFDQPVAMREFGPIEAQQSEQPSLRGRFSFTVDPGDGSYIPLRDRFSFAADPVDGLGNPPAFTMDLVSDGRRLIPKTRSLQITDHAAWDLVLSVGQIWQEAGDNDLARAAIPFALQEKNANCTHNGVLMFLVRDGAPASRVVYQISSETCAYHHFDMWGVGTIKKISNRLRDADDIAAGYQQELARRMAVKPLSQLEEDYPTIDADLLASPGDISPEHLTLYGVVVGGVHYKSSCFTRYGDYPYCEEMALPSYSTSKSIVAGLGLMRLDQLYPGASDALIADHVDPCSRAGWADITFGQTLDMSTGRYASKTPDADESEAVRDGFFLTPLHREKINRACRLYPKRERPGRQFVYHTTDHYVLGTAMRSYLAQQRGRDVDIYHELIAKPLNDLLGLSPAAQETRRTTDNVRQPYVGWGLTFLAEDVAKLGAALSGPSASDGMIALFGADALAGALQQNPNDRGLRAPAEPLRYNNGFWSYDAATPLSCKASVPIPFMSGYGGISVVMMPNGVTYYYFSDNEEFAWAQAVIAADRYSPICEVR